MPQVTDSHPWKYLLRQLNQSYDTQTGKVWATSINTKADYFVIPDTARQNLKTVRNINPNWQQMVSRGQNAASYYFRSWGSFTPRLLDYGAKNVTNDPRHYIVSSNAIDLQGMTNFPANNSAIADIALAKLKRKLQTHQGNFNSLAPIAELKEMRGLIASAASLSFGAFGQLVNISRKFRGSPSRRLIGFKYASDAWLAYGFGLRPLLSDIQAVGESISKFLTRNDYTVRLTGTHGTDWVTSLTHTGSSFGTGLIQGGKSYFAHSLSYRYVAGWRFPISAGNNYGVMDHFGITLPSLVPAAWELTAFSWAIDYFTTVGAFLDDVFTSPYGVSVYTVLDRRYTCSAQCGMVCTAYPPADWKLTSSKERGGTLTYNEFERTPLSSLPRQQLRFKTVDEMGKNGLNKVLNLAAVLAQRNPRLRT